MPKLIDVLKDLSGVINDNEFSAVIGSSEPYNQEISDEAFEKIKGQMGSLMTFDSAVNNPKIHEALKGKIDPDVKAELYREANAAVYDKAEKKLSELGEHFGIELVGKKLNDQVEALRGVKLGKQDDSVYKSEIEKLNQSLASKSEEFETFKKQQEQEVSNFKINTRLDNMLLNYDLAESYKDEFIKKGLFDGIKNELRNKATIKVQGDSLALFQKDNPELEYFEGNKKAEIKDLIEPLISPYIAKQGGKKVVTTTSDKVTVEGPNPNSIKGQMKGARKLV